MPSLYVLSQEQSAAPSIRTYDGFCNLGHVQMGAECRIQPPPPSLFSFFIVSWLYVLYFGGGDKFDDRRLVLAMHRLKLNTIAFPLSIKFEISLL